MVKESKLVASLEPFRGYVEACVLYGLLKTNILEALVAGESLPDLVSSREMDAARMEGVRLFLVTADYLDPHTGKATQKLKDVFEARGWYEMMIGGYGETFLRLSDGFAGGSEPVARNGEWVGRGSCEMSKHDSLPVIQQMIQQSGREYRNMIDMGCGSGIYLTEICRQFPKMHAVGIDPSEGAAQAARQHVQGDPAADRITIACSDAVDWMQKHAGQYDLGIICFVIHEILGQRGDEAVDDFLREYFNNSPDADMMIIDINHVWADRAAMHHPLAKNYYNQYFLLHPFTSQRLETVEYWDRKFIKLGLQIVNKATSNQAVDSTGIVMGWHLRRA